MDKSSISTTVLLFLMNLPFFGHALFEYICDEKHLFKPYLHVYKARKGPRLLDVGPGFHDLAEHMNVYVCINGPAYLYFSKTSDLGEVYEAPQLKKYAHTCEMYNVQPREGSASVKEVQLHLRAVLLLGDPEDYRRVSIQKFTAPYFFPKDQLNPLPETDPGYVPMPAHFINATSLVIIGQSECTLSKGSKNTLIKIRPFIFPPPAAGEPESGYLCKLGFKRLLEKESLPGSTPEDRARAFALINDEAIRVERCEASPTFDLDSAQSAHDSAQEEIDHVDKEWDDKKSDHLQNFNKLVDAVLTPLTEEKAKLETKKLEPDIKPKEVRRIEKQLAKLDDRMDVEEAKKKRLEKALDSISQDVLDGADALKGASPAETKGMNAKNDKDAANTLKEEWVKLRDQETPPAVQSDIDSKQKEYEDAAKKALESAREYQWALSDLQIVLSRMRQNVEKAKMFQRYQPSSSSRGSSRSSARMQHLNINPEGTMPLVITVDEEDCEKLPVLEGDGGECKKGKPDKEHACHLFKATLGVDNPWEKSDGGGGGGDPSAGTGNGTGTAPSPPEPQPGAREDLWKKDVLELIGDIFATACDRIPNVRKMVKLVSHVMGLYLTDSKIFNMKPNLSTDTCINFKFAKDLKLLGTSGGGPTSGDISYKEEKSFWNTIKLALKDCKLDGRRLAFKDISPVEGKYQFLKDPGSDREAAHDIIFHKEQADLEYNYNWPIDINWKMFVTVMGLCMSNYEKKIPLITSRFFSLYTEYFLIPLRETWINPKDNMIFQFVLGEFYNGEAEFWADMCMEASFISVGQRDYRPPRSVLVNCASEHNYFISGQFKGDPE